MLNLSSTLGYILQPSVICALADGCIGFGLGALIERTKMKKILLVLAVVVLYVLHQDFWNWRTAYPLVFGFMPIGLFYHGAFSVAAAGLMWLLATFAWPAHLEEEVESHQKQEDSAS